MPTYTKNGSIPQPHTDGTDGWALVIQEKPVPPEGKEVVWLNWQWIVRDPKPEAAPGFVWKWDAVQNEWKEYELPTAEASPPDENPG